MNVLAKNKKALLAAVSFAAVITLVATLAWLTMSTTDPCSSTQADISAAVLGDESADQEALVNRALIVKGNCESDSD